MNPRSLDGARAAIGEINAGGGVLGRAVELVVEDNLSTVEGSVAAYDRIRAEIDALGGLEPNGAAALLDAVTEDEMPTMCPLCGTSDLESGGGDFLWGLTASQAGYGVVAAQLARDPRLQPRGPAGAAGGTVVGMARRHRRCVQGSVGERGWWRDHR